MKIVGNVVFIIVAIILALYCIHYFVFAVFGVFHPLRRFKPTDAIHHFAAVIPARNEEAVIGHLIESLKKQRYPEGFYDIYAVCDHCTDHTEQIALEAGAHVLHCEQNTHSKGDVLKDAFHQLRKNKNIEAYVIFDADNLVHPDFLARMNDAYNEGYHLAQGRRTGKNIRDSWISECYEIFYTMQNVFFNHARFCVNRSGSLNGTAWMVAASDIDLYDFDTYTFTEDLEYAAIAAMRRTQIAFVPEAVTYDEYPVKLRTSLTQLKRWIFGQVQCMRRYTGKLMKSFFCDRNETSIDIAYVFLMPVYLLGALVFGLIAWKVQPMHLDVFFRYIPMSLIIFIMYAGLVVLEFIGLWRMHEKSGSILKGVFLFPIFFLMWFPIAFVCLFEKNSTWKPIVHDRNIGIEDIK